MSLIEIRERDAQVISSSQRYSGLKYVARAALPLPVIATPLINDPVLPHETVSLLISFCGYDLFNRILNLVTNSGWTSDPIPSLADRVGDFCCHVKYKIFSSTCFGIWWLCLFRLDRIQSVVF